MKLFFSLFISLIVTGFSYGQTSITLIASNPAKIKFDKADAFDLSQIEIKDTAYSDTLNFVFNKKNKDAYWIRYHANGKIYRQYFWLDPGNVTIKIHFDTTSLVIDTVLNSPAYYDYLNFKQDFSRLYNAHDTGGLNKMMLDAYINNIDNPYSLEMGSNYLRINQNSRENLAKLKEQTDKQGSKFNWFILYHLVNERLEKLLNNTHISLANFTFIDRNNKKVKLKSGKPDYYVLDLWFLACPPCIADHIDIARSTGILKQKNTQLISISTDKNLSKVNAYFSKNSYQWPSYLEVDAKRLTEELNISSYPTYIILDRSGNILQMNNSFSDVMVWLNNK
jgi:hypothetical protein